MELYENSTVPSIGFVSNTSSISTSSNDNSNTIFTNKSLSSRTKNDLFYGRYEFLEEEPAMAIPGLVVLGLATIVGTFGNILTLLMVSRLKHARSVENIFIFNLALSDSIVTSVGNPISIIAKTEGVVFLDRVPWLCKTIGSLCTIACVTSLMTIGLMSANRYMYICANKKYAKIFTKTKCICSCVSLYFIGGTLVLLNAVDIGDHGFDHKSQDCIWDRMATYPFTVTFSVILVWIPSAIIGACYVKIFVYVRAHKRRIKREGHFGINNIMRSTRLTKTIFIIYLTFIICWAPFALILVLDKNDSFSHEIHFYITLFAHLHPSLNWIISYGTNTKFAEGCNRLLCKCKDSDKYLESREMHAHNNDCNENVQNVSALEDRRVQISGRSKSGQFDATVK